MQHHLLKAATILVAVSGFSTSTLADSHMTFDRTSADTMTASISFADLDLTTPEGQRMLDKRVARAASHMCRTFGTISVETMACSQSVQRNAKQQQLAAIQRAQTRFALLTPSR